MVQQQYNNPFASAQAQNAAPQAQAPAAPQPQAPVQAPFGSPSSDDNFSFDLSGVENSYLIQPGWYVLRLVDLQKEVARSGNNMWVFTYAVVTRQDGTPTADSGKQIKRFCALTPPALGILADSLAALGLGAAGQNVNFSRQDALNRLCYGEIIRGEYNGQEQSNLQKVKPYSTPGAKFNPNAAGISIPQ